MLPGSMCIILRNLFLQSRERYGKRLYGKGGDRFPSSFYVAVLLLGPLCEEGELSHIRKTAIHSWEDNLFKSLYFPV